MHLGDLRTTRRRAPASLLALLLALALLLSACGGGSTGNGTTEPTASAPEATTPPADATQPGTGTTPAPALEKPPVADEPSDGGGARNVRVPARFVIVGPHRLEPRTITVPPFIAVQVSIRSGDGREHRFVLHAPEPQQIDVWPERRTASMRVPGLRAGRYSIRVDFVPAGALVVGGDAGP